MIAEQPPASIPDFAALRGCWHPVAYAEALGASPLRVRLLGEDLVLCAIPAARRTRCATSASIAAPLCRSVAWWGTG
jgi:hypothetical protein